jgi:hypothetical protein
MENKKPWLSKTMWISAIVALAPFIPGVGPVIAANPEAVGIVVGMVFAGLRLMTAKGVKI